MKGLNLGSGANPISHFNSWDNLDIKSGPRTIKCDLSKPLKYKNESIDYIYTSHFIEHISEKDGYNLLKECFRVLKKEGVLRLLTPDLQGYVDVYNNFDNPPQDHYLYETILSKKKTFDTKQQWLNYAMIGEANYGGHGVHLLNGLVYKGHGHKYIYDFDDLKNKILKIGFSEIIRLHPDQTNHSVFKNLDTRKGDVVQMVVEITK